MPGIRVGALYSPASSVIRVRATPLSLSTMVTVAPAMTPPLWSVTIPRMRPKLAWENSETENNNTPRIAPSTEIAFLARALFDYAAHMRIAPTESEPIADLQQEHILNRTVQMVDGGCKKESQGLNIIQRMEGIPTPAGILRGRSAFAGIRPMWRKKHPQLNNPSWGAALSDSPQVFC